MNILGKGNKYLEEGKYDLAIEEYKKAEEIAEKSGVKGLHKWNLAEAYEKSGQYDLALKEIDWLISEGPRAEVIKELKTWKSRVQKLKDAKAAQEKK